MVAVVVGRWLEMGLEPTVFLPREEYSNVKKTDMIKTYFNVSPAGKISV